jgi:ketosteroid isomerase-like protein
MIRLTTLALALVLPSAALAQDKNAKQLAQETLDKGSALFDTRDAAAMAATYTEDGQILWTSKDSEGDDVKVLVKSGRAEVEAFYREIFKNDEKTTSKNTVEYARFVTPEIMIIHGLFQPNVDKLGKYPFVQVRVKQDGKWRMKTLQFFVYSQDHEP